MFNEEVDEEVGNDLHQQIPLDPPESPNHQYQAQIAYSSSQSQLPIKIEHHTHTWKVTNVGPLRDMFSNQSALPSGKQYSVQSQYFEAGSSVGKSSQWYLSLGLQYNKNGNNFISLHLCFKKFLSSHLESPNNGNSVHVSFRLQIIGLNGEILDSGSSGMIQFGLGTGHVPCWGWEDFEPYNELIDPERQFIIQNKITFCVEMDIFGDPRGPQSSLSIGEGFGRLELNPINSGSFIGKDIGSLLSSGCFADVEIITADAKRVVKGHKAILAARSPLFRSLFEEESSGGEVTIAKTSGKIYHLQNYSYSVVKAVLKHIYTEASILSLVQRGSFGEFKRLTEILEVAHLLGLDKLKYECLEDICMYNLTFATAPEVVLILYKFKADQPFQKIVKEFILENLSELKKNEKFKNLYQMNLAAFANLIYEMS